MLYLKQILNISQSAGNNEVGVATTYGLDGLCSNPSGDEIFRSRPDRSWGLHNILHNEDRLIPG
jgi:hypothetical protein